MSNEKRFVSPEEHKKIERQREEKRRKNKKKKILMVVIYLIPLIMSLCALSGYFYNLYKNEKMYEKMKIEVKEEVVEEVREEINNLEEKIEEIEKPKVEIPIDFESLNETNEDIYAWITVPGTDVDYPVLQSSNEDDDYWLNRTVEGIEGLPGSIYTRQVNKKDFSDNNTIIYGHNMKNDTMFGSLHDFENKEFFDNNKEIIVYTPEHIYKYEVFAAVVHSDENIMTSYDFDDELGRKEFLNSIYSNKDSRSNINKNVEITKDDKIITLSTCIGSEKNHRYLVLGVLREVL